MTLPLRKWLGLIGLIGSALYLLTLAVLFNKAFAKLFDLDLAGLGSFLAGVFAPLAFLWLVLGFYQQGVELRLQAEELTKSVHEFQTQTQLQKEALDAEKRRDKVGELQARIGDLRSRLMYTIAPISDPIAIMPHGTLQTVGLAMAPEFEILHQHGGEFAFRLIKESAERLRTNFPTWVVEFLSTRSEKALDFVDRLGSFSKDCAALQAAVNAIDDEALRERMSRLNVEGVLAALSAISHDILSWTAPTGEPA
jgi:hypothetical protein